MPIWCADGERRRAVASHRAGTYLRQQDLCW